MTIQLPETRTRVAASSVCACICALLVGCGYGAEKFPIAYTTGTCNCNGEPMPAGKLIFKPIRPEGVPLNEMNIGKGAAGSLDSEGRFELTTYTVGDGAVIGRHRVYLDTSRYDEDEDGPPLPCKRAPRDMVVEIKEGSNDLTIDVGTGEVSS